MGQSLAGQSPPVPTRIESLVPLEIVLDEGYQVNSRKGQGEKAEFFLHYITPAKPAADGKFASLGIYAGASPNAYCALGRVKILKSWPASIGPWTVSWRSCPSRKQPDKILQETLIDPNRKGLLLHVFIVGNDEKKMKALEKIVTTLRLASP